MARRQLSSLGARRAGAALSSILAYLSGCSGDLINLGSSVPPLTGGAGTAAAGAMNAGGSPGALRWQAVQRVLAQPDTPTSFANGTLTRDGTQLYFTRQERGQSESTLGRAELLGGAWTEPSALRFETWEVTDASSPAVSLDGSALWFGSRLDGSLSTDIWFSSGGGDTWSAPEKVDSLNSESDDVPRPPALDDTIMPLSSKRNAQHYQIFFATRRAPDQPWQNVSDRELENVNSPDYETVDGFLTDDGLTLYFSATPGAHADLFRASRTALGESFGAPEALDEINGPDSDERDPWLRHSDSRLFFSSNRSGVYEIYSAQPVE